MPAEWVPHEATLLTWPHNPRTWPGQVEEVRDTYVNLIREITECEALWLVVRSAQEETDVRRRLTLANVSDRGICFLHYNNNDSWIRDYGPIYVTHKKDGATKRIITDWVFNGWGSKYQETEFYGNDDLIPQRIAQDMGESYVALPFVLEGGSIDVNGLGTLITSTSCLLNENRNATYSRTQIESVIKASLGIKKILWVEKGIAGDDTDGHIDDTVRFVGPNTLVCASEDDPRDENFTALQNVSESLKNLTDQDGHPIRVVKLPMPDPVLDSEGMRLPASYANFLILNDKVLVPIFNCSKDANALTILGELFPNRKIVGIDCRALVTGFGGIHCISQQVPK